MTRVKSAARRIGFGGLIIVMISLLTTVAGAETLWLNMASGTPGDATRLVMTQVDGNGTVEFKGLRPGYTTWFTSTTVVPSNIKITSIQVCYELTDPASYLSQVRMTLMREPTTASVKIDDLTDWTDPGPACITASTHGVVYPIGVAGLALRFEFADTEDIIRIGGVGLNYEYPVVDAPEGVSGSGLSLRQNFPNPFASSTTIEFQVAKPGLVEVRVYKPTGQLVRTLVAGERPAGIERIVWDGKDDTGNELAAGVYFYRVRIGEEIGSKRMVMAR